MDSHSARAVDRLFRFPAEPTLMRLAFAAAGAAVAAGLAGVLALVTWW